MGRDWEKEKSKYNHADYHGPQRSKPEDFKR